MQGRTIGEILEQEHHDIDRGIRRYLGVTIACCWQSR
ncbi:hypothetical protein CDEF62S_05703 [Castellaniella defragrans]